MKNTAFIQFHLEAGAKMVPFAGYNMPVEYSGITGEHIAVRERVGVFDVSHMGEFWIIGPEALKFLQYITSNDVSALNAANIGKDWNLCIQNAERFGLKAGKELINDSDSIAQLAVQGPLALKAMQK